MDNFAVRNLSSSIKGLNENIIKQRALEIIRYQNFRTKVAMQKMSCNMPRQTFDSAVGYLRYGTYNQSLLPQNLKNELDRLVAQHITPLTPKEEDKRQVRIDASKRQKEIRMSKKYLAKDAVPPVAKLEIIKNPVVEHFEYGVRVGNNIRLFDTEDNAKSFRDNLKFFCNESVKLVEVKVNDAEE